MKGTQFIQQRNSCAQTWTRHIREEQNTVVTFCEIIQVCNIDIARSNISYRDDSNDFINLSVSDKDSVQAFTLFAETMPRTISVRIETRSSGPSIPVLKGSPATRSKPRSYWLLWLSLGFLMVFCRVEIGLGILPLIIVWYVGRTYPSIFFPDPQTLRHRADAILGHFGLERSPVRVDSKENKKGAQKEEKAKKKYDDKVSKLSKMGFNDEKLIREQLKKTDGDLERAFQLLLAER